MVAPAAEVAAGAAAAEVAVVGSLAAEVAAAAGSWAAQVAWAAWVARVARAAAYPGERAACAKSHDLTAGLQSISLSLVATLRILHPADSIGDFSKVAFGSFASF